VDGPTLKFFAASLSGFEKQDIARGVEALCHKRREPGETAFPDLPTIEEAIFVARNNRIRAQREEEQLQERERISQHMREHPEEHVTFAQVMADFLERRNSERTEGA
jgi:hypothetical protein